VNGRAQDSLITAIRWYARIWSIPSIGLPLRSYCVKGSYWPEAISVREALGDLCFFAVLVGLVLGWHWEGAGVGSSPPALQSSMSLGGFWAGARAASSSRYAWGTPLCALVSGPPPAEWGSEC
jgi:hypothetical protein